MANYYKRFVKFKVNEREIQLYFGFSKTEFNEELLKIEYDFFKSVLLKDHEFFYAEQYKKFKNRYDIASTPREEEQEENERLLAKEILQLKTGFNYEEIKSKPIPSFNYFEDTTITLLAPLIGDILKNKMNYLVPKGTGQPFLVKVKRGLAESDGEESDAIVYEDKLLKKEGIDQNQLYLGFHYKVISRNLVFPYYFSGGKTYFSSYPLKCIIHELQHYSQIFFTSWEYKVRKAIEEKFDFVDTISPNQLLLFWCLCELYKESEAYFADSKRNLHRPVDMKWIYNFRKNLFTMVSINRTGDELWDFYNKYIDENTSLYVNALVMIATIAFAEAKKDGGSSLILLYRKNKDNIEKITKDIQGLISQINNGNFSSITSLFSAIVELHREMKKEEAVITYISELDKIINEFRRLFKGEIKENHNQYITNLTSRINKLIPHTDRFDLSKLNDVMTKDKFFSFGPIPDKYFNSAFDLLRKYTTSSGKLSPALHIGFIKRYDDACRILGITRNNRVMDLLYYKELKRLAAEKDRKISEAREAWIFRNK